MVENGQRTLSRRDHVNALAAALRVSPAELAPDATPGLDEWTSPPLAMAFPPPGDEITVTRHKRLATEFMTYMACGDTHAARVWLRRTARGPGVSPWLLLDLVAARGAPAEGARPHRDGPGGHS